MPLDPNEALTREPFKPETWPLDADGFQADLCTDCGTPVRYGSRHGRCLEPARAPGAQAAPAAVAEPNTPFADQRVQIVYGLLADSEAMPPDGQHWEGWVARRIVDALAAAPAAAQPVAWRYVPSDAWRDFVLTDDPEKATLAREHGREVQGLYTTPPALVGLSDEQIEQDTPADRIMAHWFTVGARWAERALAEANGMELQQTKEGA